MLYLELLESNELKDGEANSTKDSNNIKQHKKNNSNKKSNKKQNNRKNNVHSRLKGVTLVNQQQSQVIILKIIETYNFRFTNNLLIYF